MTLKKDACLGKPFPVLHANTAVPFQGSMFDTVTWIRYSITHYIILLYTHHTSHTLHYTHLPTHHITSLITHLHTLSTHHNLTYYTPSQSLHTSHNLTHYTPSHNPHPHITLGHMPHTTCTSCTTSHHTPHHIPTHHSYTPHHHTPHHPHPPRPCTAATSWKVVMKVSDVPCTWLVSSPLTSGQPTRISLMKQRSMRCRCCLDSGWGFATMKTSSSRRLATWDFFC